MKLYQVSIIRAGNWQAKDFEKVFDDLGQWARLSKGTWFVWSQYEDEAFYKALKPMLNADDWITIFTVDVASRNGWAPEWFWEWVESEGRTGKY